MKHIIWITGFSGAGKTTVARLLQESLKKHEIKSILLDGDDIREVLELTDQYSFNERKKIAYIYAKLAKSLSDQGFYVIVATISMFEEVRQWNRQNNDQYLEVYLKIPEKERAARDPKNLYRSFTKEMMVMEECYDEPQNADMIVDHVQKLSPEQMVNQILEKLLTEKEIR